MFDGVSFELEPAWRRKMRSSYLPRKKKKIIIIIKNKKNLKRVK